jgi:hypothetical protein
MAAQNPRHVPSGISLRADGGWRCAERAIASSGAFLRVAELALKGECFVLDVQYIRGRARAARLLIAILALASGSAIAQTPNEWNDELVEHLAGIWKLEGTITSHPVHHEIRARWVLNHQFLIIQERTAANAPETEHRYQATWFLGYDSVSERYVMHLLDVFGARYSETLGYGTRDGNSLRFVFEYPDGPFHTTFRWQPQGDSWRWQMEQKDKDGKWSPFADLTLTRRPP